MQTSSDMFYVLCEFVNEERTDGGEEGTTPVQVAFSDWIVWEGEKKPISHLIECKTQVCLKWPSNTDTVSKEVFNRRKPPAKWGSAVAMILAQSNEWTDIIEQRNTFLKHGVPVIDRTQRKAVARLSSESTYSQENRRDSGSSKVQSGKKKAKPTSKVSSDIVKRAVLLASSKELDHNSLTSDDSDVETGAVSLSRKPRHQHKKIVKEYKEFDSSESSDGENWKVKSKDDLLTKIRIQDAELKRYKKQLHMMENAQAVTADAKDIKKELDLLRGEVRALKTELLSPVKENKKEMECLKSEVKALKAQVQKLIATVSSPATAKVDAVKEITPLTIYTDKEYQAVNMDKPANQQDRSAGKLCVSPETPLPEVELQIEILNHDQNSDDIYLQGCSTSTPKCFTPSRSASVSILQGIDMIVSSSPPPTPATSCPAVPAAPTPQSDDIYLKDCSTLTASCPTPSRSAGVSKLQVPRVLNISTTTKKSSKNKTLLRAEPHYGAEMEFSFGERKLSGALLSKCRHSGKISALAGDLFGALFSKEEMALGSLSGKPPNGHKSFVSKQKLDPSRITGIVDYICKYFKANPSANGQVFSESEIDMEVRKSISFKLNNFCKTDEAKFILQKQNIITKQAIELI